MPEFNFKCPWCKDMIVCPEEFRGKEIDCPICQKKISIPAQNVPRDERIMFIVVAVIVFLIGLALMLGSFHPERPGDRDYKVTVISGPRTGLSWFGNESRDRGGWMFGGGIAAWIGGGLLLGYANRGVPSKVMTPLPTKELTTKAQLVRAALFILGFLGVMGLLAFCFSKFG
jgi:hypothetical protein